MLLVAALLLACTDKGGDNGVPGEGGSPVAADAAWCSDSTSSRVEGQGDLDGDGAAAPPQGLG